MVAVEVLEKALALQPGAEHHSLAVVQEEVGPVEDAACGPGRRSPD